MWKHFLKNPRWWTGYLIGFFQSVDSCLLQMVTLLRLQSLWSLNHAVKWGRILNINADFRFLRLKSSERLQSGQFNLFLAAVGRPLVLWKFFWAVCLILISFELLFSRRKLVIVLYILNSKSNIRNSWVCVLFSYVSVCSVKIFLMTWSEKKKIVDELRRAEF